MNPSRSAAAEDDRGVLVRPLLGVADLGARDLEDERAGVQLLRRADDRARRVVGHRAHVDRRHREPAGVAAAHRHVEIVNRRRPDAGRRGQVADDPARRAAQLRVGAERPRSRPGDRRGRRSRADGLVTLTRSLNTDAAGLTASVISLTDSGTSVLALTSSRCARPADNSSTGNLKSSTTAAATAAVDHVLDRQRLLGRVDIVQPRARRRMARREQRAAVLIRDVRDRTACRSAPPRR